MAADTGKKNNLAVHIEKIAYGAAAVAGLIIVLIPFLSTKELRTGLLPRVNELKGEVTTRINTDPIVVEPVPPLKQIIVDQWEVPPALGDWITSWAMEHRPIFIKYIKEEKSGAAVHEPGRIVRIKPGRDAAKRQVFLEVTAELGSVERTKVVRARLLRGEALPKEEIQEYKEIADLGVDKLVYVDYGVSPGKKYGYKIRTEVEAVDGQGPKVILDEADKVKESGNLAHPVPVPYEYGVSILTALGFDPRTGAAASMNGTVQYWDYGEGKVKTQAKPDWKERETFGPPQQGGQGGRYEIYLIEDGKVTIRDRGAPPGAPRDKESLTQSTGRRPVDLPSEVTHTTPTAAAPDTPGADPTPEKAAKAAPREPDEEEDKPKKPATTSKDKKDKSKDKKDKKKPRKVR